MFLSLSLVLRNFELDQNEQLPGKEGKIVSFVSFEELNASQRVTVSDSNWTAAAAAAAALLCPSEALLLSPSTSDFNFTCTVSFSLVKPSIKAFEKRERQPFSTIRQSISATATEREKEENRTRKHWNWKEKWKKVKLNAAAADAVSSGERVTVECFLSVCLLTATEIEHKVGVNWNWGCTAAQFAGGGDGGSSSYSSVIISY